MHPMLAESNKPIFTYKAAETGNGRLQTQISHSKAADDRDVDDRIAPRHVAAASCVCLLTISSRLPSGKSGNQPIL
jgi:hypothetical protein